MSVSGPYVFGHQVRAWQGVPSCTTAVLRSLHSLGLWDLELGCSVILAGCPHTVIQHPSDVCRAPVWALRLGVQCDFGKLSPNCTTALL